MEVTITGCGHFAAKTTRVALHRLGMLGFFDNLPRTAHAANESGLAIVSFRANSGPSVVRNGREILPTNILRLAEGEDYNNRSSGSAGIGAMWLPAEEMASLGAAIAGCDLTPPRDTMFLTPPPAALAKLQRLHAAAGCLAEEAPEIVANPDAARGLEQALIEAMVDCLAHQQDRENRVLHGQHAIVMRRFRRMLMSFTKVGIRYARTDSRSSRWWRGDHGI